jgi:hypothetical protein
MRGRVRADAYSSYKEEPFSQSSVLLARGFKGEAIAERERVR